MSSSLRRKRITRTKRSTLGRKEADLPNKSLKSNLSRSYPGIFIPKFPCLAARSYTSPTSLPFHRSPSQLNSRPKNTCSPLSEEVRACASTKNSKPFPSASNLCATCPTASQGPRKPLGSKRSHLPPSLSPNSKRRLKCCPTKPRKSNRPWARSFLKRGAVPAKRSSRRPTLQVRSGAALPLKRSPRSRARRVNKSFIVRELGRFLSKYYYSSHLSIKSIIM